MTRLDRETLHPGYWPSAWPVECGGNRRQKAAAGSLGATPNSAEVVTRRNGRWNVMVVQREPDEWYVGGTVAAFSGPPPFGWVERIDPETLEPLATSPELPCGEHVWCGAILVHANGSIYSVNGSYLHRLDPHHLSIEAETKLPADRSHNGLLALADGTLITKDLRLEGQGGTTISRLDPETLELVHQPLVLPEGSMGRIASDIADYSSAGEAGQAVEMVYVPGTEHLWRLEVEPDGLSFDQWRPHYRQANDQWGLSWDACLSDGHCWIMDCGDIESVRLIHHTEPNGRYETAPGADLSWRRPAPWNGPQRLLRLNLDDPSDVASIAPFGAPGGGIIAPPVHVPTAKMAIAWDSVNGGLAGIDTSRSDLAVAWRLDDVRPSMQPVVFPDSGELAINDFTSAGTDDIIVVDVATGELLDRAQTGSRIANGMFLSPDFNHGLFYCTTTTLANVSWR